MVKVILRLSYCYPCLDTKFATWKAAIIYFVFVIPATTYLHISVSTVCVPILRTLQRNAETNGGGGGGRGGGGQVGPLITIQEDQRTAFHISRPVRDFWFRFFQKHHI